MNSVKHVEEAIDAVRRGPMTPEERETLLAEAPELGRYVCRQCGSCSKDLMELFRLEGYVDRQMIDYLEHDPADYALRLRLSPWFSLREEAMARFKAKEWEERTLLREAATVKCPYRIDVPRKVKLTLAKLKGEDPNLI